MRPESALVSVTEAAKLENSKSPVWLSSRIHTMRATGMSSIPLGKG
jgi:hypothetical protein